MEQYQIKYAKELLKSIECGLNKMENGSSVEDAYLSEKIDKLYNLHHGL